MKSVFLKAISLGGMVASLISCNSFALDFSFIERRPASGNHSGIPMKVQISGQIEAGDTEKFLTFIRQEPTDAFIALAVIYLSSPGGDAWEAMKLASELKRLYPAISVKGTCASSCVILWLAGSNRWREDNGRIGVHRPTFSSQALRDAPLKSLESQYEQNVRKFKDYVLTQGMPASIFEKLMSTPSNEIYWLSAADLKLMGSAPQYFEEKQDALCGDAIRQTVVSQSANDFKKVNSCLMDITRNDRLEYVNSVVGSEKNYRWEKMKRALAIKDQRKTQTAADIKANDCFERGSNAYSIEDFSGAMENFQIAADLGHPEAQYYLGLMYEFGQAASTNYAKSVKWYRKAAEQGNADAQESLAFMYARGLGVAKDLSTAMKWYRMSADQGHPHAQTSLGDMYRDGKGVVTNEDEAIKWYRKAARQGDADARQELHSRGMN